MDGHGNIISWTLNETGEDIELFFPRQKVLDQNGLDVIRGGSHFCYPIFGTDPLGEMVKKHGFLRDLIADVFQGKENEVEIKFHESTIQGRYKDVPLPILKRRLDSEGYELFEELTIDLSSTSLNDYLNVGIHPYFRTLTPEGEFNLKFFNRHGNQIELNQRELPFGCDLFVPISINSRRSPSFSLYSKNLGTFDWKLGTESNRPIRVEGFYIWRDSFDYVCVEPVYTEKNQVFQKGRGVLTFQSITRFTPA